MRQASGYIQPDVCGPEVEDVCCQVRDTDGSWLGKYDDMESYVVCVFDMKIESHGDEYAFLSKS
jgi:hypothetical protein